MLRRRLLNLLTALSLLLFVAVAALWVRSYFRYEAVYVNRVSGTTQRPVRHFFHARSSLGSISLCHVYENAVSAMINPYDRAKLGQGWLTQTESRKPPQPLPVGWLGFGRYSQSTTHPKQMRYERVVILPYWLPTLLFALPCGVWLIARFRHRRSTGLCPSCGYDLTGNVSGVCPECGAAALPGGSGT